MSRSTVIHIGALEPHPDNIRENVGDIAEIAASMVAHGIIQPLVVSPREDKPGHFWIIAGNRRYYAARRARIEQIPVTIRRDDLTPAQITEIMLIENCQRADLNPIERAEAMGRLRKAGKTNLEIARSIGVSDATVSYFLALLELDASSQERVRNGSIPVGVAIAGVRRTRRAARKKAGQKPHGVHWEPDHFDARHPLARKAAAMCEAREHTKRRRIGKVACGECWETVIRADEQLVAKVTANGAPGVRFQPAGAAS